MENRFDHGELDERFGAGVEERGAHLQECGRRTMGYQRAMSHLDTLLDREVRVSQDVRKDLERAGRAIGGQIGRERLVKALGARGSKDRRVGLAGGNHGGQYPIERKSTLRHRNEDLVTQERLAERLGVRARMLDQDVEHRQQASHGSIALDRRIETLEHLRISEKLLECQELHGIFGRGHPTKVGFQRFGRFQRDLRCLGDHRGRRG